MTKNLSAGVYVGLVLALIYAWPRIVLAFLPKTSPWASYLYQYGLGLIFFVIGLWVIRSSGACVIGRGHDGRWYRFLVGGFVLFAAGHAVWIYLALTMPHLGGY